MSCCQEAGSCPISASSLFASSVCNAASNADQDGLRLWRRGYMTCRAASPCLVTSHAAWVAPTVMRTLKHISKSYASRWFSCSAQFGLSIRRSGFCTARSKPNSVGDSAAASSGNAPITGNRPRRYVVPTARPGLMLNPSAASATLRAVAVSASISTSAGVAVTTPSSRANMFPNSSQTNPSCVISGSPSPSPRGFVPPGGG